MNHTLLSYDEATARDRELFADMIAELQAHDIKFQTRRAGGQLIIAIESKGGEE